MSQSFVGPSLAPIIWNQCFLSDFICLSNLNTVEEDCGYSFMDNISIRLWYGFWLDHCNTLISCCILDHCPVGLMDHCKVITSCGCKTSQILTPPPLCCLCLRSLCWYGAWCWPNMQHQAPNLTNLVLSAQRTCSAPEVVCSGANKPAWCVFIRAEAFFGSCNTTSLTTNDSI